MTLCLIDEEKNPRWSPLVIFWLTKLGREADRHPCSARALEIKGTFRRAEKNKENKHLESVVINFLSAKCKMVSFGMFWVAFFFLKIFFSNCKLGSEKPQQTQRLAGFKRCRLMAPA